MRTLLINFLERKMKMELENIPSQTETEKELMEVTQENKNEGEIVARGTEENPAPQVPRIPTWDELPEWAKRLQVGELIPFKGSFFKLIGMTPDFAVVLKYEGPTGKSQE